MREIKFRAWNGEKIYTPTLFHQNKNGLWEDKVHSGILMQFTGFKDKNEKEIYEGDILEWTLIFKLDFFGNPNHISKTYWQVVHEKQTIVGFYFKNKKGKYCYFTRFNDMEIIGNIYQNPDLITI